MSKSFKQLIFLHIVLAVNITLMALSFQFLPILTPKEQNIFTHFVIFAELLILPTTFLYFTFFLMEATTDEPQ